MDSEERRFSGKVYTRRNRRTQKKDVFSATAGVTAPETNVSKSAEQPEKVVPHDLLIANSTSGNVPDGSVELQEGSCGRAVVVNRGDGGGNDEVDNGGDGGGGVELREGSFGGAVVVNEADGGGGGQPNVNHEVANRFIKPVISRVEDRVRISLTGSRSIVEIRNLRRTLEGELDHVRSLLKKIEAKEKLQLTSVNNGNNNRSIVLVPGRGNISCRYPRFTVTNDMMNHLPLVRPNLPSPFRPPSLAAIANYNPMVIGGFVEKAKRIPKANKYYNNSEFLLWKDRLPSEINKKAKTNKNETKNKGFALNSDRKELFKSCCDLLRRLMKHKHGWVFNEPVDVEALGLHDYHDIIKRPMDLGSIKTRLYENLYKSPGELAECIRLVFRNARTYNPKGHDVHVMAEELLQIFEKGWAAIEDKYNLGWRYQMNIDAGFPTPTSRNARRPLPFINEFVPYHAFRHVPQARTLERSKSITEAADPRKKKPSNFYQVGRTPVPKIPKAKDPNKRDMTVEVIRKLSKDLENLPSEKLPAVVRIIKKRSSAPKQNNQEIEVDIDSVDTETLWELDRFVTNYKKSSTSKRKPEVSLQARTRAARNAPITSSGPMVAAALKESRTGEMHTSASSTHVEGGRQADNASSSSSSSCSSSDSGSSSSDSDSDSSSSCESDAGPRM